MSNRERLRVVGWIAVLGFLLAAPPAAAQEARCTDLGAACYCSEPMNASQIQDGGNGFFQPNEAGGNAKQCPGWFAGNIFYDGAGPGSLLGPVDQQAQGLELGSSVQYVWRNNRTSGVSMAVTHSDLLRDSSVKKVCWRYYIRYSGNFVGNDTADCNANKTHEAVMSGGDSGPLLHGDLGPGGMPRFRMDFMDRGSGPQVFNLGGGNGALRPSFSDCVNEWCRVEACIDGNFDSGTDYWVESNWVGIESGKTYSHPRQFVGRARDGGGMKDVKINMYRQSDGSPGCVGHKWISHLMEARWSSRSPSLKIGAACEMEGSCGGGSGGGPPAAPPARPELIP